MPRTLRALHRGPRADGGTPMVWLLRQSAAWVRRRFLEALPRGTMAGACAQATGAVAALPDRQVVATCGDGGLTVPMAIC